MSSISWLLGRDVRVEKFSRPKQPHEHFWSWIFITRSKVLHAATFFPHQALVWPSSCCHCSFVSRQSLPLFSPIPASSLHKRSWSYSLFSGLLPTHGCGGNLDVLKHSHSPCSCSPLEDRGRLSFVSHPVRRNAFTQGRTPRSEHEELLCMESSSNSKEQGTLEAGCKLENHLWYWTTSLSKPNQTTPSTLKV